jgi:hypothetical protein
MAEQAVWQLKRVTLRIPVPSVAALRGRAGWSARRSCLGWWERSSLHRFKRRLGGARRTLRAFRASRQHCPSRSPALIQSSSSSLSRVLLAHRRLLRG